jgi:hypothetical protein
MRSKECGEKRRCLTSEKDEEEERWRPNYISARSPCEREGSLNFPGIIR